MSSRGAAKDFFAQRDCVIGVTRIFVTGYSTFVHPDGAIDVTDLEVKIAHLVIEPEFFLKFGRALESFDDLQVRIDRLTWLIFEFELSGLVFELFDFQNEPLIGWLGKPV